MDIRRWVPVFEEFKIGTSRILHLVGHGLSSLAREGGNQVRVARGDGDSSQALRDGWDIVIGGRAADSLRELADGNLAVTGEAIRSSLEIFLLGEQEDQAAGLARIRRRDIEVEGSGNSRIDSSVEPAAVGGIGLS